MCKYTDESIQSQGKKNNKNYIKKMKKNLHYWKCMLLLNCSEERDEDAHRLHERRRNAISDKKI